MQRHEELSLLPKHAPSELLLIGVARIDQPPLAFDLAREFLFGRQDLDLLGRKDLAPLVQYRVLRDGLVLLRAQDQADGRVVTLGSCMGVEHAHVGIHLASVLMGKLTNLEVDQHKASENRSR